MTKAPSRLSQHAYSHSWATTEGALQAAAPPGKPKGNLVIICAKWSGTKPVSATPHALPTSKAFTPKDVPLSLGIKTFLSGQRSGAYLNHCGITYSPSLSVQTTSSLAKERVCFSSISLQLESNVKSHKRKLRDSCFSKDTGQRLEFLLPANTGGVPLLEGGCVPASWGIRVPGKGQHWPGAPCASDLGFIPLLSSRRHCCRCSPLCHLVSVASHQSLLMRKRTSGVLWQHYC